MVALLFNFRVWLAIIVALALAASHWKAYVIGKNTERVAVLEATQVSIIQARAEEKENAKRVQDAQSNQVKALAAKAADAERAIAERNLLRHEIHTFTEGSTTPSSCSERTITIGELFGACTERYEELATKASGHVVDIKALISAWPK